MKGCLRTILWTAAVLLLVYAGLMILMWQSFRPKISERKTVRFTFPTGEIIANESYIESGFRDRVAHNHLTFQDRESAPAISMGRDVLTGFRDNISVTHARLFRFPDHLIIIVDPYVFILRLGDKKPSWMQEKLIDTRGTQAFLRLFSKTGHPTNDDKPEKIGQTYFILHSYPQDASYRFDHLDENGKTLATTRQSNEINLPQSLVYRLSRFSRWDLDMDATRKANNFSPPPDPGLVLDISVVKYPGDVNLMDNGRDQATSRQGASEVSSVSRPLRATDWVSIDGAYTDPSGTISHQQIEAHFGFWDTTPSFLSLFLQGEGYYGDAYQFVHLDEWNFLGASGYGDGNYATYYRVRKP